MNQFNFISARAILLLVALSSVSLSSAAHTDHANGYRLFAPLFIHSSLLHQQRQHQDRHLHSHKNRYQSQHQHQHHPRHQRTNQLYAPQKNRQHNHSYGRYSQSQHQPKHHRH